MGIANRRKVGQSDRRKLGNSWPAVTEYMPSQISTSEAIKEPFNVEIKTPTDFSVIRSVQRVVGKYDELRFVFRVPEEYAGKTTEISIISQQPGKAEKYGILELPLPLKITSLRWKNLIVFLALTLFLTSTMEKAGPLNSIPPEAFRSLGILLLGLYLRK